MHHHGRIDKHRGQLLGRAWVDDTEFMWSRRYAKSILLQAYLECLSTVCHSKCRDNGYAARMQTKLVKMLTSKTKITDCSDAYKFCLELWDDLSLALIESQDSSVVLPSKDQLARLQGHEVMVRLALLADFYRYQRDDLALNKEESTDKLCVIRSQAFRFLTKEKGVHPELGYPTVSLISDQNTFLQPLLNHQTTVESPDHSCCIHQPLDHPTVFLSSNQCSFGRQRDLVAGGCSPRTVEHDHVTFPGLHDSASPITTQSCVTCAKAPKQLNTQAVCKRHKPTPGHCGYSTCKRKHNKWGVKNKKKRDMTRGKGKPCSRSFRGAQNWEDSIKWSKFSFAVWRKPYYTKMIRAFQVVKNVGHPTLTLNSEWGLSCYYRLAVAYTTDKPLEMAAACLPDLREAVNIIHSEQFQKLSELTHDCQMLLYAVLNCNINWVDHNHKQILLIPGQPSLQPPPEEEGDLRCSRCLKNQTFHSSEVKGNPRNIDVGFDFEQMKFGSSCCSAPMINVPLSTRDVNTCTFTEMKQMYTSCMKCKQPIFSEVLVDMDTLYSRCVVCTSKGL